MVGAPSTLGSVPTTYTWSAAFVLFRNFWIAPDVPCCFSDPKMILQGWPIFLLAEASLHTQNIKANGRVSLLCQTPREAHGQPVSPVMLVVTGVWRWNLVLIGNRHTGGGDACCSLIQSQCEESARS